MFFKYKVIRSWDILSKVNNLPWCCRKKVEKPLAASQDSSSTVSRQCRGIVSGGLQQSGEGVRRDSLLPEVDVKGVMRRRGHDHDEGGVCPVSHARFRYYGGRVWRGVLDFGIHFLSSRVHLSFRC